MLHVDKTQEATPDVNLSKKLLKKEQRLFMRLQEEQEAEARAQDRFQRAQTRLQRRLNRLERISSKLLLVRKQIADLQITDQQSVYTESTSDSTLDAIPGNTEPEATSSSYAESDVSTTTVSEQEAAQESAGSSPSFVESTTPTTIEQEPATSADSTAVEQEAAQESAGSSPSFVESTTPATSEQEPVDSDDSSTVKPEVDITAEVNTTSGSIMERVPTKPLQLEQENQPAARSLSTDLHSAKEAWVGAESALQNARNAAHDIAASISFLSQSDGLSNEFMEELVCKQADANQALLKAQDAARVAYERFVQTQRDAEHAASQPIDSSMNTSEDLSQQKQESGALPPAEDNGADQTAKLHAIRLYKEW